MVSVPLSFAPPTEPDIANLHIFESDNADSGFIEIDVISVGVFPDYITRYTTPNANRVDDWFAITWENIDGVQSPLSAPIKGGTTTLIGELVDRVLLRSPDQDENVVLQEAEATVSFIYKVDDPYSIDINDVDRLWLTELTNLTLVAAQYVYVTNLASSGSEYTVGMVSEGVVKGDAGSVLDALERLEKRAMRRLGIGGSLIGTIQKRLDCEFSITGVKTSFDSSRLLSTRAIITENVLVVDQASGVVISDR